MLQFWQVLCLMLALMLALLWYEKGIRPDESATAVPTEDSIEAMIEKEVL